MSLRGLKGRSNPKGIATATFGGLAMTAEGRHFFILVMFYAISFFIILACLAGIAFIVVPKFPQLALIDTEIIPKEREAKKKRELIDMRVSRMLSEWWSSRRSAIRPAITVFVSWFRRQYLKVLSLQEQFRKPVRLTPEELLAKVSAEIAAAQSALQNGDYSAAEKSYINIIKLDRRSVFAYSGLGDLYMLMKQYGQAKETYEFLVKISEREEKLLGDAFPASARADAAKHYLGFGLACRALGDERGARRAFERAIQQEPANPRYLDLLLETCILQGDKPRARQIFDQLKAVNPENQKLGEFFIKIAAMREMRKVRK